MRAPVKPGSITSILKSGHYGKLRQLGPTNQVIDNSDFNDDEFEQWLKSNSK